MRQLEAKTINMENSQAGFVLTACLFASTSLAAPADHFVTSWTTTNPGDSNDTSITVPMVGGPYDVDWDNDGIFDDFGLNGEVTHDFGAPGTYTIRIRGDYEAISFPFGAGDPEKLVELSQWGTGAWTSMAFAFTGARFLLISAQDTPDFSAVTSMQSMFFGATLATPDTTGWDTSQVTRMPGMFSLAYSANPDTSNWDVSNVTDMDSMFAVTLSANPDTSQWDTSSVTDMTDMFAGATVANPDTSQWDTSSVTDMRGMFAQATAANPDTSNWDTSKVVDMSNMFYFAISANPDVGSWNTSLVQNMSGMFAYTNVADPDTSSWDTSRVQNMEQMFDSAAAYSGRPDLFSVEELGIAWKMFNGITLPQHVYDSLLVMWNAQSLRFGVIFDGGASTYCSNAAQAARENMIVNDGWEITDAGRCIDPLFRDSFGDQTRG